MFKVRDRVRVDIDKANSWLAKKYIGVDEEFEIINIGYPDLLCEIKSLKNEMIHYAYPVCLIKIGDLENISQKSLNSTLEELYEMILKENCSEDLKSKFWDLHKVLSSKEKEVKTRLEEINKLLWE